MSRGRVLLVEDEPEMRRALERELAPQGFEVTASASTAEALATLSDADGEIDVVLTDLRLPGGVTGLQLCELLARDRPGLPVIGMTGFGLVESAIGAIRAGAYDFVTKPIDLPTLQVALDRAVRHRRLTMEVGRLRTMEQGSTGFREIIGESPAIRRLRHTIAQVAATDATVLITGESGSGKELVARAIHEASARARGPLVSVNCAALPEALMESELFGHRKGAFTDARDARRGLFLKANGGTLFLDEIGELPTTLQPKLLRALQERRVRPVGSDEEAAVDIRLVTATNRDLESAVEEGRFREDLWYRVNVVQIAIPALRDRGSDVLLLAQHFVHASAQRAAKEVDGFSRAVAERLLAYDWPGNVRELESAMERGVALTKHRELVPEDLPERVREDVSRRLVVDTGRADQVVTLEELERRYIARILASVGGNKRQAAKLLGVDRKTLYRKIERFRIEVA